MRGVLCSRTPRFPFTPRALGVNGNLGVLLHSTPLIFLEASQGFLCV